MNHTNTNAATSNGNTYLRLFDDTTARNSIKLTGSGSTTVTSDANGTITINSVGSTYNNASQSTAGLMSAADKTKLDNIATTYATKTELNNTTTPLVDCTTAAATVAKVVTSEGLTLARGTRLLIRFTNGNTIDSPTLNLNNSGAKAIKYRGYAVIANALTAGGIYDFVYDGTAWEVITPLLWIEG